MRGTTSGMMFVRCRQLSGYFLSNGEACLFANGWKGDMPHAELYAISAVDSEILSHVADSPLMWM